MDICSVAIKSAGNLKALIRGQDREIDSSMLPNFMDRVLAIQKINEALDIFLHQQGVMNSQSSEDGIILRPSEWSNRELSNRHSIIVRFGEALSYNARCLVSSCLLPKAIVIIGDFYNQTDDIYASTWDSNSSFASLLDHLPGGRRFEIIYDKDELGSSYWEYNIERRFDIAKSFQYRSSAAHIFGRERHALAKLRIATLNAFGYAYESHGLSGLGLDKTCVLYFHKEEDEILARVAYPNGLLCE